MVKVALYCRVSTLDQSVAMQQADLQRYAEQRDFEIYREYCDQGISGSKDRRPALNALLADARKRLFDGILVWRFDRFARSTKHLLEALDEFNHLGLEFISYQENIDTSSPLGKAIFSIVSAIAELEVNLTRERVRSGMAYAKARGIPLGRKPVITQSIAEQAREMKARGHSLRTIAKALGIGRSSVHKALKIPAA